MDTNIDWLSFTMTEHTPSRSASELYEQSFRQLRSLNNGTEQIFFDGSEFNPAASRAPYRVAISRAGEGARIYGASHTGTILFELSGTGCSALRDSKDAKKILGGIAERVTRFDIAVDIFGTTNPAEFASCRKHDRFRSSTHIQSRTGETCYVGSPKSDRFCRVYRYSDPHPRAALLRVEFVFRRRLAKSAVRRYIDEEDISRFVAQLGNTYGYDHKAWQPGFQTDERLVVPPVNKSDQDTVGWLYRQVAPAIRRVMDSGSLDMVDFLDYVYSNKTNRQ